MSDANPNRRLKISVFQGGSGNYHAGGWRHPGAVADSGTHLQRWVELIQLMERAKFDMMFIADGPSAIGVDRLDMLSRTGAGFGLEPLTLLAALSVVTKNIGLAATVPTTWHEPYNLARNFASLDHISGGRAAWNAVTGRNPEDAANFSRTAHVPHDERYDRAEEFMDIVKGLWDSFEDDAPLRDKAGGRFFDPDKVHLLRHSGKHFSVKGPLNVARPPQGHPVVIQAGTSEAGRQFAARNAEVIFTMQSTLAKAQTFRADIRRRVTQFGRSPDSVKVMPGLMVYVAPTREEAAEKMREFDELMPLDYAIHQFGVYVDFDFSGCDPHAPLPRIEHETSRLANPLEFLAFAYDDNMSLAQAAIRTLSKRGHWSIVGTPEEVADEIELWFRSDAIDGLNLLPPIIPGSLHDFIDMVLPILRERGLFRTEYEGTTLRENLGLERPKNRFVPAERS